MYFAKHKSTYPIVDVTNVFFENISKHHGLLDSTMSDLDNKFCSKFWKKLMKESGVRLKISSSKHSQANGASEIICQTVKNYICCYCSYRKSNLSALLPATEFVYCSSASEALGASSIEFDQGQTPNRLLNLISGSGALFQSAETFKDKLRASLQDIQN